MSAIMICGTRRLPPGAASLVGRVVGSTLAAGRSLVTGCATGADAAAVSATLAIGAASRLQIMAVGGADGAGFAGRASAIDVVQAAARAGAGVRWWAGGPASLPIRSRLAKRSAAALQHTAMRGPGSGLVAIVTAPPPRHWSGSGPWWSCGSGTWSTVAAAAARGMRVVVLPASGPIALPSLPGTTGVWAPAGGGGVWAQAWAWAEKRLL